MANRGRRAILILPLEEYVAGTLAAETSPAWNAEALKAQAVVSRTYALHRLAHPRALRYDVVGSVLDQVFRPGLPVSEAVSSAVHATRAEYLTAAWPADRDAGAPLNALFHASCGGATDTAAAIWGRDEGERGVRCPSCAQRPFRWTATLETAEFLTALGLPSVAPESVRLHAIARTSSARLRVVRIEASTQALTLSAEVFRSLLGYHHVRSARFEWSRETDGRMRFDGVGAGHGVGLCQVGAQGLSAEGRRYAEILAHYYPDSRLVELPKR